MIRCSECGHENMDGLEYCDACGAKLPAVAPAAAEPAPAPMPVVSLSRCSSQNDRSPFQRLRRPL